MNRIFRALITTTLFVCFIANLSAQVVSSSIIGTVLDSQNQPAIGITIFLKGTNQGTATNTDGTFVLNKVQSNTPYTLVISGIGYKEQYKEVVLTPGQELVLSIVLKEDLTEIDEIVVQGKSNATQIKEKSFTVNSIATKKLQNITTDVNQVLNQTSGIRIKESGGLGSRYEFSLNGLSGRQVRIFVDDIPVDQLGSSFNLNNLTVNLVDRIDVYKGVVPIKLGADALGGAVNIITNKKANSFLDASYSIGSFNTHRAALNSKYRFQESGLTFKATGFYNYSDNNYQMNDQPVFVNGEEQELDIERFHDQYTSAMGNFGVGFTNVKWADNLMAKISVATIEQEIQSGIYGTPVGEATEEENNTTYSIEYSKTKLLNDKLDVNLFVLYNEVASKSIDTSSNRYDWQGNIVRTENNNLGELVREKTIFEYDQTQFLYRAYATYDLAKSHQISVNHIGSMIERKGENRLNAKNNEPFRSPNTLNTTVSGLGYQTVFFDSKLENVASLKYYNFDMLTKNAVQFQHNEFGIQDIRTSQQHIGYAFSSRYFIQPQWYIKASYEKGYRIPQPIEIFGDGLRILANPNLEPETSHNLNIGMTHRLNTNSKWSLRNEINLFQRDVDNFIFIQQFGVFSTYENVLNVLIKGVEYDVQYSREKLTLSGNLTWQQVLNNEKYVAGTTTRSRVYRDKMPNTPYLFANVNANFNFGKIFSKIDMSMYYAANYVHEYFLNYPSISITETKNIIPNQFLSHIGTTFSAVENTYNLSVELRNVFNAEAYDNFNLQKPGRAVFLKFRYFLK
ncbi:TonB-dependent receptor [Aquimarina aquimarini]|uniref:TonB-dependent receptor n=1 Tax=Aquimarina aquimarini TaxID=1191734 RepID=UPI000D556226|nr:TonB-dependent receptor [Aquimarina aquimarini]